MNFEQIDSRPFFQSAVSSSSSTDFVRNALFSPDGNYILTSTESGSFKVSYLNNESMKDALPGASNIDAFGVGEDTITHDLNANERERDSSYSTSASSSSSRSSIKRALREL